MSAPAWLRKLARDGAVLMPHGEAHAVFASPDRRRRPLARVLAAQLARAEREGWLARRGPGHVLSAKGHATLRDMDETPRSRHRVLEDRNVIREDGRIATVSANANEGALGKWAGLLGPAERNAADRFLADYHRSSLAQNVTRNWSPTAPRRGEGQRRGPEDAALGAIAAKDRVMDTLDALGPTFARIVEAMLVREESLAAMERRFGWGRRSGGTVVKLALARLAEIYGMS